MKKFYVYGAFGHYDCTAPEIAACYCDSIELKAKTARGARAEAERMQARDDRRARRVIERARRAGLSTYDLETAYNAAPLYVESVFYDDENGERVPV